MRQAPGTVSEGGDPSQQNVGHSPVRQAPSGSSADPGGEAGSCQVASSGFYPFPHSPDSRLRAAPAGPGGCRTEEFVRKYSFCVWSPRSQATTRLSELTRSPRGLHPRPMSCSGSPSRQGKAQTRKQVALGPFIHARTSSRGYTPSPQICRGLRSAHCPPAWSSSQDRQWGPLPQEKGHLPRPRCSSADEDTVVHSKHIGGFIVLAEKTEPGPTLLTLGCGDTPRPAHCSPQRGSVGVRWAVLSAWVDGGTAPPPAARTSPPSR